MNRHGMGLSFSGYGEKFDCNKISPIVYLKIKKDTSGKMFKEKFVPLTHSTTVTEKC